MTPTRTAETMSFEQLARLAGESPDDYRLTWTAAPVALSSDAAAGWVTVRKHSTGNARTYSRGTNHDWISRFATDLAFGIFDDQSMGHHGRS